MFEGFNQITEQPAFSDGEFKNCPIYKMLKDVATAKTTEDKQELLKEYLSDLEDSSLEDKELILWIYQNRKLFWALDCNKIMYVARKKPEYFSTISRTKELKEFLISILSRETELSDEEYKKLFSLIPLQYRKVYAFALCDFPLFKLGLKNSEIKDIL